ncbi:helix-turn-helix transcriptional regulator [Plantactinospora sp. B6F1]|uniref:Scr1 family TA system antitoxin-like transcriptional regulator n=1 Tax=Plantactinospora sp. B6F1 TaxID=3158971 RepID=UPI00102CD3B5
MTSSLARIVRHFRSAKGLTQDQAASAIKVSGSLIAAFETDRRIPKPDTARRLDGLFGTGDLVERLASDARKGYAPDWFRSFDEYEREALALRKYEPLYIPGLLQTEAYARAVLAAGLLDAEKAEELLTVRFERQDAILNGPRPPLTTFVMDEAALLRGDPGIMKEQLRHLLDLGARPRVSLHVVPLAAGLYVGQSGPFTLASLEDGTDVGFMEDQLAGRVITDPEQVAALTRVWDGVRSVALPRNLTHDAISKLVNGYDR